MAFIKRVQADLQPGKLSDEEIVKKIQQQGPQSAPKLEEEPFDLAKDKKIQEGARRAGMQLAAKLLDAPKSVSDQERKAAIIKGFNEYKRKHGRVVDFNEMEAAKAFLDGFTDAYFHDSLES